MARAKQYADRVNIIKRIKLGSKWPFAPVVERNGRIVRDHVLVAGREEHHPEGRYYLEWYEDGKRRRKSVPKYEDLLPSARSKSIEVNALKVGLLRLSDAPVAIEPARLTMGAAIDDYLEYIRKHRSLRTYRTYRPVLNALFRKSYKKTYVDEVSREDILKFASDCSDMGLLPRTVYDRMVTVLQLFKRHGYKNLVERSDWPNYVETIRPIYEPEEIAAMLKHSDPDEAILVKFCLASGFRDREIRYVTWRDIDFRNCVVRVTAKPIWRFKPKNYEERAVPVPGALIEKLVELKDRRNAVLSEPVFPNTKGKPNSLHIEIIKEIAYRAKLNCGQCVTKHGNRCSSGPYCQRFFLHKFRHTFATEHLRDGVDIRIRAVDARSSIRRDRESGIAFRSTPTRRRPGTLFPSQLFELLDLPARPCRLCVQYSYSKWSSLLRCEWFQSSAVGWTWLSWISRNSRSNTRPWPRLAIPAPGC